MPAGGAVELDSMRQNANHKGYSYKGEPTSGLLSPPPFPVHTRKPGHGTLLESAMALGHPPPKLLEELFKARVLPAAKACVINAEVEVTTAIVGCHGR